MRRIIPLLVVILAASVLPIAPALAGGYSYGTTVYPTGTSFAQDPTVWLYLQAASPSTIQVNLTLSTGQTMAMTYNPSLDVASVLLPTPPAPGTQVTGDVSITDPGYTTEVLSVSFTEANTPISPQPESLAAWQFSALLNRSRTADGLPTLSYDQNLAAASMAHATYYQTYANSLYATGTFSLHDESATYPVGYTGDTPVQRDLAVGAVFSGIDIEVLATGRQTVVQAYRALMDTTFHRFGLLSAQISQIGVGWQPAVGSVPSIVVSDISGNAALPVTPPAQMLFPVQGATDVPLSYTGESPNPLSGIRSDAQLPSDPAGYPVSISFSSLVVNSVQISSAQLTDASGVVPTYLIDGSTYTDTNPVYSGESMARGAALFAQSPLTPGTVYTAAFSGTEMLTSGASQPFNAVWSFTTRPTASLTAAYLVGNTLVVTGHQLDLPSTPQPTLLGPSAADTQAWTVTSHTASTTFATPPSLTGVSLNGQTVPISPPPFSDLGQASWAAQPIISAWGRQVVQGIGHGLFAPLSAVTGLQAITLIYRQIGSPGVAINPVAASLPVWSQAAVSWALAVNLITPEFVPSLTLAAPRDSVVQWLMQGEGVAPLSTPPPFSDASQIPTADAGYVAAGAAMGVVNGFPNGTFQPASVTTRAAMVKLLSAFFLPNMP
ncbi:MAG: CAP and S-layer homology domain-containing protein [Sulfobacillus sp.]